MATLAMNGGRRSGDDDASLSKSGKFGGTSASGSDCPCCIACDGAPFADQLAPSTTSSMDDALAARRSGQRSRTEAFRPARSALTSLFALLALFFLAVPMLPGIEAKWLPSTADHHEKWPCRDFRDDFDDPSTLAPVSSWDGDATSGPNWLSEFRPHTVNVKDGYMIMEMVLSDHLNGYNRSEGAQTVVSLNRWMKTGKACARLMTSRGNGTVSALVAMSYNGSATIDDEIDIEFTGRDQGKYLQTNWFGYERPVYGHGITDHPISSDSSVNFHTYCFERTSEYISWEIDGYVVRKNTFKEWGDKGLPWRESKLVLNLWDGGMGDNGTAWWSGGPTDWRDSKNPNYRMVIDWFQVWCYDRDPDPTTGTRSTKTKTATMTGSKKTTTSATKTTTFVPPQWLQAALPTTRTLLGGFPTVVPLSVVPRSTESPPEATQPPQSLMSPTTGLPRNTLVTVTPTHEAPADLILTKSENGVRSSGFREQAGKVAGGLFGVAIGLLLL